MQESIANDAARDRGARYQDRAERCYLEEHRTGGHDRAVLFGSTVQGSASPRSDVDVLVVGSAEFSEVSDALAAAEKRLGREINPMVYAPDEFRRRVGERGHFVQSLLKSPRISLIGELPDDSRDLARPRVAQAARNVSSRDRGSARGRQPRA